MTGKRVGLGSVGLGIAVVLIAGFASRRMLLEEWHLSRLQSTDDETRKKAAQRLGECGSARCIPPLMQANSESAARLLKAKGNTNALITTEGAIANLLDQQKALAQQMWRTSVETQETWSHSKRKSWWTNMMKHIGALDSRARALATEVTSMFSNEPFFSSLLALVETEKKEAIPHLSQALEDENWHVRWQAVRLLAALGPDAKDSAPMLQAKLDDPNSFVRHAAAQALKSIGHENGR